MPAAPTHEFLDYLHARRLAYSIGFGLTESIAAAIGEIPDQAWTPAYDTDDGIRDGAWVAEAAGVVDLSGWPPGMRLIVRRERPHPGRSCGSPITTGWRLTAFVTNASAARYPSWSYGIAAVPAAKTASTPLKTPHWPTFLCTASTRIGSGAPSCNWPASSPPGCRCWPCTSIPPAAGNPNAHGCACFRSPPASTVTPAEPGCDSLPAPPGHTCSPTR